MNFKYAKLCTLLSVNKDYKLLEAMDHSLYNSITIFFFWLFSILVAAHGIFVVAHGIFRCGTWASEWAGSVVAARGLSCPAACGILVLRSGIEPASPALEGGFFTTGPPGKSLIYS